MAQVRAIMGAGAGALATLALAGCGDSTERTITADGEEIAIRQDGSGEDAEIEIKGEEGSVKIRTGDQAGVAGLPAPLQPYPGSRLLSSADISNTAKGEAGAVVSLEADATPPQVAEHYRSRIEGAGGKVASEFKSDTSVTLAGELPGKQGFMVSATETEGGRTSISIVAGNN